MTSDVNGAKAVGDAIYPNRRSRQTALMWQQQPDYARYKEKSNGEGCLVNRQDGTLIQIKPDAPTQHAQFVLVSYYRLSARLWETHEAAADAQSSRNRNVDQPAEDRLATLHTT